LERAWIVAVLALEESFSYWPVGRPSVVGSVIGLPVRAIGVLAKDDCLRDMKRAIGRKKEATKKNHAGPLMVVGARIDPSSRGRTRVDAGKEAT
jgi:hypothetical protein